MSDRKSGKTQSILGRGWLIDCHFLEHPCPCHQ